MIEILIAFLKAIFKSVEKQLNAKNIQTSRVQNGVFPCREVLERGEVNY